MKCELKNPTQCLNCPFHDCINEDAASESEKALISEFAKNPEDKRKEKKRIWNKQYREAHREELKAYLKTYAQENKERIKKYRRAYYLAHRTESLERQKIYDREKRLKNA